MCKSNIWDTKPAISLKWSGLGPKLLQYVYRKLETRVRPIGWWVTDLVAYSVTCNLCVVSSCLMLPAYISVRIHNSRTHSRKIFKLSGGVDHVTCHTRPLTKVKRSKMKVTTSRNVSAAITLGQRKFVSTSNLVKLFIVRGKTYDTWHNFESHQTPLTYKCCLIFWLLLHGDPIIYVTEIKRGVNFTANFLLCRSVGQVDRK